MTKTELEVKIKEMGNSLFDQFITLNNMLLNDVPCIHKIGNTCYELGEDKTTNCSIADCDRIDAVAIRVTARLEEKMEQYEKDTYPDPNKP